MWKSPTRLWFLEGLISGGRDYIVDLVAVTSKFLDFKQMCVQPFLVSGFHPRGAVAQTDSPWFVPKVVSTSKKQWVEEEKIWETIGRSPELMGGDRGKKDKHQAIEKIWEWTTDSVHVRYSPSNFLRDLFFSQRFIPASAGVDSWAKQRMPQKMA